MPSSTADLCLDRLPVDRSVLRCEYGKYPRVDAGLVRRFQHGFAPLSGTQAKPPAKAIIEQAQVIAPRFRCHIDHFGVGIAQEPRRSQVPESPAVLLRPP